MRKQIDSSKLRGDQTRQAFRRELKNRFQILGEEQEMNFDSFNQMFKEAREKVHGIRKKKEEEEEEEWIQEKTWKKIEKRREINQRMNS